MEQIEIWTEKEGRRGDCVAEIVKFTRKGEVE